jgi:protein-disulfide isomerase
MRAAVLLLVAAVASAAVAAPAPKAPAAAVRDWTRNVVATPEGGFRMGNPSARVKLVEYGSLTCPHCAQFSTAAKGPLAAQVRSGRVSFEFRNMILNAADVSAALLARCAGPRGFFPLVDRMYATQPNWLGKATQLMRSDPMTGLPESQKFTRIAETTGLMQLAGQAGLAPARAKACLADKAGLDRLVALYQSADQLGVRRTPTFFINGVKTDAHEWAALEPLLARPPTG